MKSTIGRALLIVGLLVAVACLPMVGHAIGAQIRAENSDARAAVSATSAQAVTAAPALSEQQRLKLQNVALQIDLTRLRLEMLSLLLTMQQQELDGLVRALQVDGFTLDLSSLSYRPNPHVTGPEGPASK